MPACSVLLSSTHSSPSLHSNVPKTWTFTHALWCVHSYINHLTCGIIGGWCFIRQSVCFLLQIGGRLLQAGSTDVWISLWRRIAPSLEGKEILVLLVWSKPRPEWIPLALQINNGAFHASLSCTAHGWVVRYIVSFSLTPSPPRYKEHIQYNNSLVYHITAWVIVCFR